VLYELLTGHTPFEAGTLTKVCARVLHDEPVSPRCYEPEIPEALEALILSCLQKRPSHRPATIADLACALAPFAGPEGVAMSERVVRVASGLRQSFHMMPGFNLDVVEPVEPIGLSSTTRRLAQSKPIPVQVTSEPEPFDTGVMRAALRGRPSGLRWASVAAGIAATVAGAAWLEPWAGLAEASDAHTSLVAAPASTTTAGWAAPPPPRETDAVEVLAAARPAEAATATPRSSTFKRVVQAYPRVATRDSLPPPPFQARNAPAGTADIYERQPPPPLPSDSDPNPL